MQVLRAKDGIPEILGVCCFCFQGVREGIRRILGGTYFGFEYKDGLLKIFAMLFWLPRG